MGFSSQTKQASSFGTFGRIAKHPNCAKFPNRHIGHASLSMCLSYPPAPFVSHAVDIMICEVVADTRACSALPHLRPPSISNFPVPSSPPSPLHAFEHPLLPLSFLAPSSLPFPKSMTLPRNLSTTTNADQRARINLIDI